MTLAATWILTYAMHSVAVCVIALGVVRVTRLSTENRCIVWRVALFVPFITTSLGLIASTRSSDSARISVIEPFRRYAPSPLRRHKVEMTVTTINGQPERNAVEVDDPFASASSMGIVLIVAAAGAAGLFAHRVRTSRIRHALAARTIARNLEPIAERRGIKISESDFIEVPIALCGREICLPRSAFNRMRESERVSVLLHEIAHVERRDPLWMDASRILSVMTWWQPLNRIVCERLELDTESAADDRAVALGARPHALVAGLAHFAGLIDAGFAGAGAALLNPDSPLVARAKLILDRQPRSDSRSTRRLLAVVLIGAAGLLAVLPVPTTIGATPPAPGQARPSPGGQFVEEEKDVTIIRNDRQP